MYSINVNLSWMRANKTTEDYIRTGNGSSSRKKGVLTSSTQLVPKSGSPCRRMFELSSYQDYLRCAVCVFIFVCILTHCSARKADGEIPQTYSIVRHSWKPSKHKKKSVARNSYISIRNKVACKTVFMCCVSDVPCSHGPFLMVPGPE